MSYAFNGSTGALEAALGGAITDYPFSVSIWFRPHSDQNNATIFCFSDGAASGYQSIQLRTTTKVRYRVSDGTSTAATLHTDTTTINAWNHVLIVGRSATDRRIFLNGAGPDTGTASRAFAGGDDVRLGCFREAGAESEFYDGNIGPVAIWDRALPDSAGATLYLGIEPTVLEPAGLIFYVEMLTTHRDRVGGVTITENAPMNAAPAHHPRVVSELPATIQPLKSIAGTGASTLAGATSSSVAAVNFQATGSSSCAAATTSSTALAGMVVTGASTLAGCTSAGVAVHALPAVTGAAASSFAALAAAGTAQVPCSALAASSLGAVASRGVVRVGGGAPAAAYMALRRTQVARTTTRTEVVAGTRAGPRAARTTTRTEVATGHRVGPKTLVTS